MRKIIISCSFYRTTKCILSKSRNPPNSLAKLAVGKVFWSGRKEVWLATKFAAGVTFKYWPAGAEEENKLASY